MVSLWLRNDDVRAFEEFEKRTAKVLARHGGRIERVIRSTKADAETPFEIHIVSFPDQQSYADYGSDPEAQELAAEREKIISRTTVVEGFDGTLY